MNKTYFQVLCFALLLVVASSDRLPATKETLDFFKGDGIVDGPLVCNTEADCENLCINGPRCIDHKCVCLPPSTQF
ncbi:hypothetical protein LINPERHAP1_LOCUS929 [Linum perenne]